MLRGGLVAIIPTGGAVAQPGERLLCKEEVRGSSPLSSTWGVNRQNRNEFNQFFQLSTSPLRFSSMEYNSVTLSGRLISYTVASTASLTSSRYLIAEAVSSISI